MHRLLSFVLIFLFVLFLDIPANAGDSELFLTSSQGIVNTARVNLRSGPDIKEDVVGMIPDKNTLVEVLGRHEDWYKVRIGNSEARINGVFLTLNTANPASNQNLPAIWQAGVEPSAIMHDQAILPQKDQKTPSPIFEETLLAQVESEAPAAEEDIETYDYIMECAFQLKRIADLLDEANEWERKMRWGI